MKIFKYFFIIKGYAMIKKLMMMCLMLFPAIQAQDIDQQDIDLEYQELIYDMGISLIRQQTIIDNVTAKNALVNLYNEVEQVNQIIDLFMIIDEELVELEISTVEDLIDFQIEMNKNMAQSCIAWLAAYQHVFTIFLEIHGSEASFIDWCHDIVFIASLEGDEELENPLYEKLWQASYEVLEAQKVFEVALQELE
jgi:hypothetical protein